MADEAALINEDIVATELDDGEGVLVDLNSKRYYQLNETAMLVWHCLEKGRSLSDIVDEMTAAYEVTPEHATASVKRVIEDLRSNKLLQSSR